MFRKATKPDPVWETLFMKRYYEKHPEQKRSFLDKWMTGLWWSFDFYTLMILSICALVIVLLFSNLVFQSKIRETCGPSSLIFLSPGDETLLWDNFWYNHPLILGLVIVFILMNVMAWVSYFLDGERYRFKQYMETCKRSDPNFLQEVKDEYCELQALAIKQKWMQDFPPRATSIKSKRL